MEESYGSDNKSKVINYSELTFETLHHLRKNYSGGEALPILDKIFNNSCKFDLGRASLEGRLISTRLN